MDRDLSSRQVKLSIIVVNWNTELLLRECLTAVYDTTEKLRFEVIVVDNASSDNSIQMVREHFPHVRLIVNEQNLGFAKATNQGVSVATGTYVLLLNSDVMLQEGVVQRMIGLLERRPEAGIVGSALVIPDVGYQLGAAGFEPTLASALCYYFFLSKLSPLVFKGIWLEHRRRFRSEIEVDWVSGACLLTRSELFRTLGPLDESYFMYLEDVEWCKRARRSGWKTLYLPTVEVLHRYRGSASPSALTQWLDSLDRYYRSSHSRLEIGLFHSLAACGFLVRSLGWWLVYFLGRQRASAAKSQQLMAYSRKSWALVWGDKADENRH
jgi:GT2 family glycosyltransferase